MSQRRKGLKADYRGATPGDVALALHRHNPNSQPEDGEVAAESAAPATTQPIHG